METSYTYNEAIEALYRLDGQYDDKRIVIDFISQLDDWNAGLMDEIELFKEALDGK